MNGPITLNINNRSRDCRIWDLTRIPYYHAIQCMFVARINHIEVVDDFYKNYVFDVADASEILPFPDLSF